MSISSRKIDKLYRMFDEIDERIYIHEEYRALIRQIKKEAALDESLLEAIEKTLSELNEFYDADVQLHIEFDEMIFNEIDREFFDGKGPRLMTELFGN